MDPVAASDEDQVVDLTMVSERAVGQNPKCYTWETVFYFFWTSLGGQIRFLWCKFLFSEATAAPMRKNIPGPHQL